MRLKIAFTVESEGNENLSLASVQAEIHKMIQRGEYLGLPEQLTLYSDKKAGVGIALSADVLEKMMGDGAVRPASAANDGGGTDR